MMTARDQNRARINALGNGIAIVEYARFADTYEDQSDNGASVRRYMQRLDIALGFIGCNPVWHSGGYSLSIALLTYQPDV